MDRLDTFVFGTLIPTNQLNAHLHSRCFPVWACTKAKLLVCDYFLHAFWSVNRLGRGLVHTSCVQPEIGLEAMRTRRRLGRVHIFCIFSLHLLGDWDFP